ncbi:hypothetical protein [Vibrio sp. Vb0301]|uniref:hypothetical protein n=1 Tax=Vibrio sp. Vb0301 TaxID=3074622 RepID=UPI00296452FD|nr:hypothetical protein [Vibrio sp. Vb0301]
MEKDITDETKAHFVVHWHLAGKRGRLVYHQFVDTNCDIVGPESTAPHLKQLLTPDAHSTWCFIK